MLLIPVQAAAALAAFTLESPTKPSKKEAVALIDDEKRSQSPESVDDATDTATDTLPDFRRKFVGEIDLPESSSLLVSTATSTLTYLLPGEEPLLKESRRRFVLFPIQYHEVRNKHCC